MNGLLSLLVFIIAVLYSNAGFGGASADGFIAVNSISGLVGQFSSGASEPVRRALGVYWLNYIK